jgi:hypothetical protein
MREAHDGWPLRRKRSACEDDSHWVTSQPVRKLLFPAAVDRGATKRSVIRNLLGFEKLKGLGSALQ